MSIGLGSPLSRRRAVERLTGGVGLLALAGWASTKSFAAAPSVTFAAIARSNFPLADRNWHAGDRNDLATDGPIAHLTLHHGQGHESALHFRAYTGEITVNTPMSDTRSGSRP